VVCEFLNELVKESVLTLGPCQAPALTPRGVAPRYALIEITHQCNLQCAFCYAESVPVKPEQEFLSAREWTGIFKRLAAGGIEQVCITGGEPLARVDSVDILRAARREFPSIALSTNGTLIHGELAQELVALTDAVTISVDSGAPGPHDRLRGAGSHAAAIEAVRALTKAGHPRVDVISSRTRMNNEESLYDVADLALACQAHGTFYCYFVPSGRARGSAERFELSPRELIDLWCRSLRPHIEELGDRGSPPMGADTTYEPRFQVTAAGCGALVGGVVIGPSGDVYPCSHLKGGPFRFGCIADPAVALEDLLQSNPGATSAILDRVVDAVPGCRDCQVRYFCHGGCMARAWLANGDLYSTDPLCPDLYANERAKLWSYRRRDAHKDNESRYLAFLERELTALDLKQMSCRSRNGRGNPSVGFAHQAP